MGCASSSPLPVSGDPQLRMHNATRNPLSRFSLEGKIVLLGDSGVGKSSLALRFCRGRFPLYHEVTIGAAFLQQTVRFDPDGNQIKLYIWDTGGQERFRAMAPLYYRDAAGAVVVYDVTAPSSLDAVKFWARELQNHLARCSITVAANKCDLLPGIICDQPAEGNPREGEGDGKTATAELEPKYLECALCGIEEVRSFCASYNFAFVICSAKSGYNVNKLFEDLARDVFAHLKDVSPVNL